MPLLKVNQIASYSGNTLTIGTTGDTVTLAAGSTSSGFGATYNGAVNWTSNVVTSALTVSAGIGYFVNTSSAAITLTLPASPTFGSIVGIADYSGYALTNNITINPNGNKLEGGTTNKLISTNKESVILNYVDTTRGWLATSGVNNGTDALSPLPYSIDFLVVAGGGAGSGSPVGGGGGAGGYRTSTQSVIPGTVITVTVGDGGAATPSGTNANGASGSGSSITGSGLTTITSAGGGGGGYYSTSTPSGVPSNSGSTGSSGGSGGGGGGSNGGTVGNGGSGNTPSTSPSQGNNGGNGLLNSPAPDSVFKGGGGGGASSAGITPTGSVNGNGGNGTASSITGSSVTYAGGGGGAGGSTGGSGGGGSVPAGDPVNGGNGTVNLGGGGGGGRSGTGGAGGKGVVILSVPTANYSNTSTGSPTVTTSGSNTILQFNGSGSYTA
jgi:hypothetical protein